MLANKPQPKILQRPLNQAAYQTLLEQGAPELLARIAAGRVGEEIPNEEIPNLLQPRLAHIPHPKKLADCDKAVSAVLAAIAEEKRIGILTDYDVDGITSHAILWQSLVNYFHVPREQISSLIGHRLEQGYGISDGLVDTILAMSADKRPELIISADCGSSDEPRIARLLAEGIQLVVTDHHAIPDTGIPQSALAVLNPTRCDCDYPDATIAGCVVAWLFMSALRAELVAQQAIPQDTPKLTELLDFCALGTVADAVSLASPVNRAIVNAGLAQMNQCLRPAWSALVELLEKPQGQTPFDIDDLGFQIGPRINARGRMSDPHAARRFLLAEESVDAMDALLTLDRDNQDRRKVERAMLRDVLAEIEKWQASHSIVAFDEDFHPGVQGIVASRLIDRLGKPAVVLSPSREAEQITGSMRTVPGVHARDTLQTIADNWPQVMIKFGGHAGAAGLTIHKKQLDTFRKAFNETVEKQAGEQLVPVLNVDGELDATQLNLNQWQQLQQIRNSQDSLAQQLRTLNVLEAHLEAGVIDLTQVDQFRQSIETERATLLQSQNGFRFGVEGFLTGTLGLPPKLPVELDDSLIEKFQLVAPNATSLQDAIARFQDQVGNLPDDSEVEAIRKTLTEVGQVAGPVQLQLNEVKEDLMKMEEAAAAREEAMSEAEARLFQTDRKKSLQGLDDLQKELDEAKKQLTVLNEGLNEETKAETIRGTVVWLRDLHRLVQGSILIQARARLEAISVETINLDSETAVKVALANRIDWMNGRASLVDSWRLIAFNADALQANVTVAATGNLRTSGDNPIRFDGRNSTRRWEFSLMLRLRGCSSGTTTVSR